MSLVHFFTKETKGVRCDWLLHCFLIPFRKQFIENEWEAAAPFSPLYWVWLYGKRLQGVWMTNAEFVFAMKTGKLEKVLLNDFNHIQVDQVSVI